jgi:hypothetical protein
MHIQNLQTSPIPQTSCLPWTFVSFSNLIYSTISLNQVFFILSTYALGAPKAEFLLLKLIHLFAREVLLVKNLEIEETKTT